MAGGRLIKDEPGCRIRVEPGAGAAGVVVKIYRRRGLAAGMRALLCGGRARREFEALTRLASSGVPCSPPLAWRRGFSREHGFYELLATREIPGAAALEERLKAAGGAGPGFDAAALFRVVAGMHRAGVYHGALGPKNILVAAGAPGPPGIYLVDFARAKIFPASIFGRRIAGYDLLMLVVKLERHLPAGACRPYLSAYGLEPAGIERLYAEAASWGTLARSAGRKRLRIAAGVLLAARSARKDEEGPWRP
jgi:hypothetical protein